mgnify:CR=1 FL=1
MNDLKLHRILKAPRALIWECFTQPEHLKNFFIPKPHKILDAEVQLFPGGRFYSLFEVDGTEYPNEGCVLEVVTGEKLVTTDTLLAGYIPAPNPFFTAIMTFADHPDGTEYTALARHGNPDTRKRHEEMGFHEGWGTVADQLETYAQGLQN